MLDEKTILENLCAYDKRNPDYLFHEDDREYEELIKTLDLKDPNTKRVLDRSKPVKPRTNCSCDNCFYGRDKLAIEILRLRKLK